jgi:hypothetical protein
MRDSASLFASETLGYFFVHRRRSSEIHFHAKLDDPWVARAHVLDEWTRECLAIDVAGGIRSGRVIDVLTRLVSLHGAPLSAVG